MTHLLEDVNLPLQLPPGQETNDAPDVHQNIKKPIAHPTRTRTLSA